MVYILPVCKHNLKIYLIFSYVFTSGVKVCACKHARNVKFHDLEIQVIGGESGIDEEDRRVMRCHGATIGDRYFC